MWYRYSSKDNNPSLKPNKTWVEIVPENIWILQDSKIKIFKIIEIDKNLPISVYKIKNNDKEIKIFNDLEIAKKFAEELDVKKLPEKGNKN